MPRSGLAYPTLASLLELNDNRVWLLRRGLTDTDSFCVGVTLTADQRHYLDSTAHYDIICMIYLFSGTVVSI